MDKKMFNNLVGERLYFKPVSLDDVAEIHKFASDKNVSRFIGWNLSSTMDDTLELVESMLEKEKDDIGIYASIFLKSTKTLIGTCMIFNFDLKAKHAEVGYVLSADYWNKGYGTETISLMVDYAFEELKLHKLHARVTDVNVGSSKILEKNGFLLEGNFKDYYFVDDKYYNGLFWGKILK